MWITAFIVIAPTIAIAAFLRMAVTAAIVLGLLSLLWILVPLLFSSIYAHVHIANMPIAI